MWVVGPGSPRGWRPATRALRGGGWPSGPQKWRGVGVLLSAGPGGYQLVPLVVKISRASHTAGSCPCPFLRRGESAPGGGAPLHICSGEWPAPGPHLLEMASLPWGKGLGHLCKQPQAPPTHCPLGPGGGSRAEPGLLPFSGAPVACRCQALPSGCPQTPVGRGHAHPEPGSQTRWPLAQPRFCPCWSPLERGLFSCPISDRPSRPPVTLLHRKRFSVSAASLIPTPVGPPASVLPGATIYPSGN